MSTFLESSYKKCKAKLIEIGIREKDLVIVIDEK